MGWSDRQGHNNLFSYNLKLNSAFFFFEFTRYNFRNEEVAGAAREPDEALKATKMEELKNETIPFYLGKLDAIAKENNGYLALGQVKRETYYCSDNLFANLKPHEMSTFLNSVSLYLIPICFCFWFHSQLTWADVYFAAVVDVFSSFAGFDLIENYSNLQTVVSNVNSVESIKAWIDSRPATDY